MMDAEKAENDERPKTPPSLSEVSTTVKIKKAINAWSVSLAAVICLVLVLSGLMGYAVSKRPTICEKIVWEDYMRKLRHSPIDSKFRMQLEMRKVELKPEEVRKRSDLHHVLLTDDVNYEHLIPDRQKIPRAENSEEQKPFSIETRSNSANKSAKLM